VALAELEEALAAAQGAAAAAASAAVHSAEVVDAEERVVKEVQEALLGVQRRAEAAEQRAAEEAVRAEAAEKASEAARASVGMMEKEAEALAISTIEATQRYGNMVYDLTCDARDLTEDVRTTREDIARLGSIAQTTMNAGGVVMATKGRYIPSSVNKAPIGMDVEFRMRYETKWGERIVVMGDLPELGNWEAHGGVQMRHEDDGLWIGETTLPAPSVVSYKYVVLDEYDTPFDFQEGANQVLALPAARGADGTNAKVVVQDTWSNDPAHGDVLIFGSSLHDEGGRLPRPVVAENGNVLTNSQQTNGQQKMLSDEAVRNREGEGESEGSSGSGEEKSDDEAWNAW
jgi:hypothetical protein